MTKGQDVAGLSRLSIRVCKAKLKTSAHFWTIMFIGLFYTNLVEEMLALWTFTHQMIPLHAVFFGNCWHEIYLIHAGESWCETSTWSNIKPTKPDNVALWSRVDKGCYSTRWSQPYASEIILDPLLRFSWNHNIPMATRVLARSDHFYLFQFNPGYLDSNLARL